MSTTGGSRMRRRALLLRDAIEGRLFVLRKGAKQNHLVRVAAG